MRMLEFEKRNNKGGIKKKKTKGRGKRVPLYTAEWPTAGQGILRALRKATFVAQ